MVVVHFIDPERKGIFSRREAAHVPRVGDELRFNDEQFFVVERVVWCYDEKESQRANVEIKPC